MPEVTVKNLQSKTIHCDSKTEKLLNILLTETDWMHACGMKGRCTTCTAKIITGAEHLGPMTDAERRFCDQGKLGEGERLACQAQVLGNIEIEVPEAYKLPHLAYN